MENLLEFLFNELETEESAVSILTVNNTMNLEELEDLYFIED